MTISQHISLHEATFSKTAEAHGMKNIPNLEELSNMRRLAREVFEPLRNHIEKSIRISSFFRSVEVNRKIGGSPTSQHCRGQAMDIETMDKSYTNADLFHFIRDNLNFDQLIWEFGTDEEPDWVHVSYCAKNRMQILRSFKDHGKTIYQKL